MKKLLAALVFFGLLGYVMYPSHAGPPPTGYQKQATFLLFCDKDEAALLLAVSSSFHEYISATADIREGVMKLFLFEDPDDRSMSIVVTQGGETCLVFSGENISHFDEPDYIPSEGDTDT